jgi:N-methylhydantoinase B
MRDGAEGSGANFGFLKNTPVEISEAEVPVTILGYGLARDSGGAGQNRGGLGTEMEFEVHAPHSFVTARNRDRSRFAPWGLEGGEAGKTSAFLLNRGSNREVDLGNTDIVSVDPGDRVYLRSAGAGGWGRPWKRAVERVVADVRRGFVSAAAAEAEYGVVIRDGAVDAAATASRRAAMEKAAGKPGFGFNRARLEYEAVWTREAYEAFVRLVGALPVHWRYFVKQKLFAAVEALPPEKRRGDPAQLHALFDALAAEYPQLAAARAKAAE